MNLKIEMSFQNYCRMLKQCRASSDEYGILVNGNPARQASRIQSQSLVEIICNAHDAAKLIALGDRICPEAAREIEKSVDFFPEK